jgi:hypothetical protein
MKSIFVSKTFWVNVISGILGILSLPQVAQLPPSVLMYIGVITPLLNVILRRISDTPVIFKLPANILNSADSSFLRRTDGQ